MARLANAKLLTPPVLEQLMDPPYCKRTFNLGHPFLKSLDPPGPMNSHRFDERGYSRYWSEPLRVGSKAFFVCSQWFEPQRAAFDRWVRHIELGNRLPTAASLDAGSESTATPAARPIRALLGLTR